MCITVLSFILCRIHRITFKAQCRSDLKIQTDFIFRISKICKTQVRIVAAMASFIESQAVLEARLKAAGFTDDVKDKFIAAGITCLSQLAFMSSYSPGANDETPLIDAFRDILSRDPTIGEKANMRRVFNEAYASVTAEMRQNVERVEDTTIRKLSQPDRHDRYIKQVARLTGVAIKGATEPGDSLVDAFFLCMKTIASGFLNGKSMFPKIKRCKPKERRSLHLQLIKVQESLRSRTSRLMRRRTPAAIS